MPEYRVMWEIDVEAESPRQAAEKALEIQREADYEAVVVFSVTQIIRTHLVDLLEDSE